MRLTADMRLARNSRLINGWEIVGGAFAASVKPNMAERQASTLESIIRGRHIYKQIVAAAIRRDTNLGTGGRLQP